MADQQPAGAGPAPVPAPAPAAAAAKPAIPAPPYDAIVVPRSYPDGRSGDERHVALRAEFAKLLGDRRVMTRHCGGDQSFITSFKDGAKRCHRYWPKGLGKDGEEFYDWADRGDGVLYGMLTEEAKAHVAAGN